MRNDAKQGLAKLLGFIIFILLVRWANAAPLL